MTARKLFNFVIDEDLAAGLKAVKERDGISEGEQARRAIRAWLEAKGVLSPAPKSGRKRAVTRKRP